jgi:enediyne polyketide synthase
VIHAVQACIPHATLLPVGVDRIVPVALTATPLAVRARERSHDGEVFVYDLEVNGEDGNVIERWHGLQLRRVGDVTPDETWTGPLLGPYMERRLGELNPGSMVSVVVEGDAAGDRMVGGNRTTMVAGPGVLAYDAGPVMARPLNAWRELLGPEHFALAESIAERTLEDVDTAASRVRVAIECLRKANASADLRLLLCSTTADHWVCLTAGHLKTWTWVTGVRGLDAQLTFAVVMEASLASV